MQSKCATKIEINKVGVEFTSKKITAYGGFSLLAAFFERIKLRELLEEVIPVKREFTEQCRDIQQAFGIS